MQKERVIEALKQGAFLLVALVGGGVLSNLPMMLPGIFGVFISKENTGNQMVSYIQWGIMAVIGALTCILAAYLLSKSVGDGAALFTINHNYDRTLDKRYMLITIASGVVVYLLVSMLFSFPDAIDGPVAYLMRILGGAERSIHESEVADIPYGIKFLSMMIHLVYVTPFCFMGYLKGYRERIEFQSEEEAEKGVNENSPR